MLDHQQVLNDVVKALRAPILRGVPLDEVEANEQEELEYVFWNEGQEEGPFDLTALGVINGYLAQQNKTLVIKEDAETGAFVGLEVRDGTWFAAPVEN